MAVEGMDSKDDWEAWRLAEDFIRDINVDFIAL
jgi:hypothetical protein